MWAILSRVVSAVLWLVDVVDVSYLSVTPVDDFLFPANGVVGLGDSVVIICSSRHY